MTGIFSVTMKARQLPKAAMKQRTVREWQLSRVPLRHMACVRLALKMTDSEKVQCFLLGLDFDFRSNEILVSFPATNQTRAIDQPGPRPREDWCCNWKPS